MKKGKEENDNMALQVRGKCKYCGREYAKGYMARHLKACPMRKERLEQEKSDQTDGWFLIEIEGRWDRDYWLFVEISENVTLVKLDSFIRDIWVECCGHLSSFDIQGVAYDRVVDRYSGLGSRSMRTKLMNVLWPGLKFSYEYDFGSTTELILTVKDYRVGAKKSEKVTLLSRNNLIVHRCSICGKEKAVFVSPTDLWETGNGYYCEKCADRLNDEEKYLLPVCNSPRMGVCAYEGSAKYPDQFMPDV